MTAVSERSPAASWPVEVLDTLTALNSVDRAALKLIYWRGLTQTQVARDLHLPRQVVRQCVARGMHELAASLTTAADSST